MDELEWIVNRMLSISNQMHEVVEETGGATTAIDLAFFAARLDRAIVRLNNIDEAYKEAHSPQA